MRILRILAALFALLALGGVAIFATSAAPPVDAVDEARRALGIPLESSRVETKGIRPSPR